MLQKWIESVLIKRVVLALAAGGVSYLTVHIIPDVTPVLNKLASVGLAISIHVTDAEKLREAITIALFAATQGAHEWLAVKYPEIGKYI